ncbi:MAG TPA: SAF domain-containing protein [Acidimicrobiales bacterium]|nr:SAF domain-containing protein [Acidimicrobiales bacterium]
MRLRRLSRSPLFFWAAVAVLALLTASVVGRLVGQARAAASRYGSLRPAAVATRPVAMGAVVGADDVEVRRVPAAFLPEDTIGAPEQVVGQTAVVALFPGQPVVRAQLARWGRRGVAALLPPGARAVSVPTGPASPRLERGDVVDVLATFAEEAASAGGQGDGGAPTFPVATAALVVDVGEESATVAVGVEEAARVAFAVVHGAVTLALTADPPATVSAPR